MSCEVLEQVHAEVAAQRDKSASRDPAGQPPKQVVARDDAQQETDRGPQLACGRSSGS
jgi:hypothetical protein